MIQLDFHPDRRKIRQFGIAAMIFALVCATIAYRKSGHSGAAACWLAGGGAVLAASWLLPPIVRPLYIVLQVLAFPIGFVVSHLVLGLIFYGLFTPVSLIFKVLKRDPLSRALSRDAATYWTDRGPQRPPQDYYRQF